MIRSLNRKVQSRLKSNSALLAALAVLSVFCLPVTEASAVSARVKFACAKDYYAHCSKFAPDTPEVRQCMRAAGKGLSPRCVNALVAEGEVSGKEVADRVAKGHDDE